MVEAASNDCRQQKEQAGGQWHAPHVGGGSSERLRAEQEARRCQEVSKVQRQEHVGGGSSKTTAESTGTRWAVTHDDDRLPSQAPQTPSLSPQCHVTDIKNT